MKPTQQLRDLGQSLWLDNIKRELLTGGKLRRYIGALIDPAVKNSTSCDDEKLAADLQREGAASFVKSRKDLLDCIDTKSVALAGATV